MKLIDGDALAEKVRKVKNEMCVWARLVDDESYACGAFDAFLDVLSYIEEAPDLGQQGPAGDQDPGRLRDPAADPESEEGNG